MSKPDTTSMSLNATELEIMTAALCDYSDTVSAEGGDTAPIYEFTARVRRAESRLHGRRPAEEVERERAERERIAELVAERRKREVQA